MHLFVYTSELSNKNADIDQLLSDITKVAKRDNMQQKITGLLFYHQGRFLQLIEGPISALENLMAILERDTRHNNIEMLFNARVPLTPKKLSKHLRAITIPS